MFKRYYIKSKVRFSIFFISISLFILFGITGIFNKTYASMRGGNDNLIFYAVTVESGDTLWSIASDYAENDRDIRRLIYEINNVNHLETAELTIGQQLIIPA